MIKEFFLSQKISTKLLIFTFLFSVFITLLFSGLELLRQYEEGYEQIEQDLLQVESSYLEGISHSSWVYDTEQISLQLKGIVNMPTIKYAEIRFEDGTIFRQGYLGKGKTLRKKFDILYTNENKKIKLGELFVVGDVDALYARVLNQVLTTLASQLLETLLSIFFILYIFKRLLTRHLLSISEHTRSLDFRVPKKELVLDKELSKTDKDELDELVSSINMMEDKIYESYDEISKELQRREKVEKSLLENKNRLEKLYMTDTLTGMGNRNKLIHDLECSPKDAMVIIDIDDFKEINDFYGYKIGDNVILECAHRLEHYTADSISVVYRLHADQFAITYENIINKVEFQKQIELLIEKVTQKSILIDQYEILIGVAAGIAVQEEELYIDADLALQIAKKTNKQLIMYNKTYEIEKEYEKNLKWTKKLKKALADGRITAFFQPIYNQKLGKVEKCEALVRMIDEDGEIISPFFFLGVAKKSKLYPKITIIMIDKVVQASKMYEYKFSINFTIDDILNENVRKYFKNAIIENRLENRIVVELVESENIENFEQINSFIHEIKKLGCKVAIDDFGTGYSNFEYLLRLNADFIKIDGSLIKNIDKDKNMFLVAENIVNFAKIANMKTIAEFVCSKEIKDILDKMDIDYTQGYYISEPLAFEDMYKIEKI